MALDDIARFNRERWEALAQANVEYSRPALDLTPDSAWAMLDPEGMMGEVARRDALCLAGGGGQQSAAFALLGARVTVLDLCETQLERDRQAAAHYGVEVRTIAGDMRDLSAFARDSFDVVWHAHSLSFIPDAQPVFCEVARVLRPRGRYRLAWHNPFTHGLAEEYWDGQGYPLRLPYVDGAEVTYADPDWTIGGPDGETVRVPGPREFRHGIGAVVNGLIHEEFAILGLWEDAEGDQDAPPGTWLHYKAITAPYLTLWAEYRPGAERDAGAGCDLNGVH
jgi:SAM-dependent methyltransferase